jgi:hypothetical protein
MYRQSEFIKQAAAAHAQRHHRRVQGPVPGPRGTPAGHRATLKINGFDFGVVEIMEVDGHAMLPNRNAPVFASSGEFVGNSAQGRG